MFVFHCSWDLSKGDENWKVTKLNIIFFHSDRAQANELFESWTMLWVCIVDNWNGFCFVFILSIYSIESNFNNKQNHQTLLTNYNSKDIHLEIEIKVSFSVFVSVGKSFRSIFCCCAFLINLNEITQNTFEKENVKSKLKFMQKITKFNISKKIAYLLCF